MLTLVLTGLLATADLPEVAEAVGEGALLVGIAASGPISAAATQHASSLLWRNDGAAFAGLLVGAVPAALLMSGFSIFGSSSTGTAQLLGSLALLGLGSFAGLAVGDALAGTVSARAMALGGVVCFLGTPLVALLSFLFAESTSLKWIGLGAFVVPYVSAVGGAWTALSPRR